MKVLKFILLALFLVSVKAAYAGSEVTDVTVFYDASGSMAAYASQMKKAWDTIEGFGKKNHLVLKQYKFSDILVPMNSFSDYGSAGGGTLFGKVIRQIEISEPQVAIIVSDGKAGDSNISEVIKKFKKFTKKGGKVCFIYTGSNPTRFAKLISTELADINHATALLKKCVGFLKPRKSKPKRKNLRKHHIEKVKKLKVKNLSPVRQKSINRDIEDMDI
jgi:hypothetical protein